MISVTIIDAKTKEELDFEDLTSTALQDALYQCDRLKSDIEDYIANHQDELND
jgi:hypothetical protein